MSKSKVVTGLGLVLFYSLSVHLGVLSGQFVPALVVLAFIAGMTVGRKARSRSPWLWLLLLSILTGLLLLWSSDIASSLLLLPPITMNLLLALVFGGTLLPGATPLITQFSKVMKGYLNERALIYTRQVTVAWVFFFALMAAESALLAFYATPFVWSLFTNFLNYIFVLLFLLLEYFLRTRLVTEVEHPGFIEFIRSLTKIDPKCIKTL